MVKAQRGVLIKCDASIREIIKNIDAARREYILEELDDEHLLIKAEKLDDLKRALKQRLKDTLREPEEEDSGAD